MGFHYHQVSRCSNTFSPAFLYSLYQLLLFLLPVVIQYHHAHLHIRTNSIYQYTISLVFRTVWASVSLCVLEYLFPKQRFYSFVMCSHFSYVSFIWFILTAKLLIYASEHCKIKHSLHYYGTLIGHFQLAIYESKNYQHKENKDMNESIIMKRIF